MYKRQSWYSTVAGALFAFGGVMELFQWLRILRFMSFSDYVQMLIWVASCAVLAFALLTKRRDIFLPVGFEMCIRDRTMMVFTWAQLGYLLIQTDSGGKVLLHKRMDMGNERSLFENKIFALLFGSRQTVDATGYPYAKLSRKVSAIVPNERNMYKGVSGNMKIFRGLCCGAQIFCGVCVAMNMTSVRAIQILLSIILGAFGAVSGWLIQDMAYRTHLRGKLPMLIGAVSVSYTHLLRKKKPLTMTIC